MSESILSQLQKINNLPTLPLIAQEILKIATKSTLSIEELINIVGRDVAIMAKILSVANSAFFRVSGDITNLSDSIMRIGINNVKSIAIGISALTLLSGDKRTSEYSRLYNHSLFVGLTAQTIARNLKMNIADDILIEGLLHDLGYLVLQKYFPDIYKQILKNLENNKSVLDADKDIIELTHADIGFWLAEKWELPDTILDTTLYHHTPSLAKRNEKHVGIVHIADYITTKNTYSPIEIRLSYPIDQGVFDILQISEKDLTDIELSVLDIHDKMHSAGSRT
jgi:putative nucleotidyltransferase with HDIG domain